MTSEDSGQSTTTHDRELRSPADLAHALSLAALLAVGVAYMAMFGVLGDSNFAVKFENGEVPPGFDITGGQTAAVVSAGAALLAFILIAAAGCVRTSKLAAVVAVLGLLAAVPYAPLELLTRGLAF
jgi:hypothetical protein